MWEDTRCPDCRATLIRRSGFRVLSNRLTSGACPDCGAAIPGRWNPKLEGTSRTRGIPLPVLGM
jgi:hypothetical protein